MELSSIHIPIVMELLRKAIAGYPTKCGWQ